jgi:hypothetical protein
MSLTSILWRAALAVVALNLPFGFWRAGLRKYTLPWIVAVHAPVPLVIAIRYGSGLGWQLVTFPVLVGAFFTGQFVGGRLRRAMRGPV